MIVPTLIFEPVPSHPSPLKYRWLEVGKRYKYQAKLGKALDSRRGQVCEVLIVPRPGQVGNVKVRFDDGVIHVVPAGVLKPVVADGIARAVIGAL